jgi:hypothetical protein
MTHKNRQLSANEVAALDVITKHPGLMPKEIIKHIDNSQMSSSSISACTSRLIWLRKVNRVKVHGSPAFRYYPTNHPLPQGHTQWNNALVKVDRSQSKKGNGDLFADHVINKQIMNEAQNMPAEEIYNALKQKAMPNVLIVLPLGEKETITVTIEQARTIWMQLNSIFGGK